MATFTVYLDDSGTDPNQPIANASALIIPDAQILKLESNWERFLEVQGFSDFHAAACAAPKSKDKQYQDWDDAKRKHVFMRVRQFCKRFGVQTFGFSVYKQTFNSVFNEDFRHYVGGHYTWALRHVVREIEDWRKNRRIKEPIQCIFDWQELGTDCRDEIDDVVAQMSEYYQEEIHYEFNQRKEIPGLQCVDLIAWLTLQLGLNKFRDKPMEGRASESIRDFENYFPSGRKVRPNEKWFQVATVQKPQLQAWFRDDTEKGKSVPWFRDWYKRHPGREVLLDLRKARRVLAATEG